MSSIAAANGFGNFLTIWQRPENASIAALRDPHALVPGDRIFIPDRLEKEESRGTDAAHLFQADIVPVFLRVRLEDREEQPLASTDCDLTVPPDPAPSAEVTDGKGTLEKQIPRQPDMEGRIIAHAKLKPPKGKKPDDGEEPATRLIQYDLRIGKLNCVKKFSGQQARLNNLGYFAGYTVRDVEALLWAAEEFECEKTNQKVTARPKIKPARPAGEDEPDTETAEERTGIQDAKIISLLEKTHGI